MIQVMPGGRAIADQDETRVRQHGRRTIAPTNQQGGTPPSACRGRRIVIVGGGFGGLACARALAGAEAQVTLIDRRNHHLFQPLLYQVSTAALSPADIAAPIRRVLARARNVDVVLADVTGVDTT